MRDDELLDALGGALDDSVGEPDPARIDAIRAAAERRRAETEVAINEATEDAAEEATDDAAARRGRARWPYIAAAAAAIVLVIGAVVGVATRDSGSGEIEYSGPITGSAGSGELIVTKTGIGRVIELETRDLAILPTGELYEVWFVGPGDSPERPNRISAGTFHPDADGRSNVVFAAAVDPALYPLVQITAEPGDGNPLASGLVVLEVEIG